MQEFEAVVEPNMPQFPPQPPAFTRRGVLIGLAITVMAIILAFVGLTLRRTRKDRTTAFWGQDAILAFESGREVQLARIDGPQSEIPPTDGIVFLTDLPGLGHFRHALLDDRHYQWDTVKIDEPTLVDDWFWLRIANPIEGRGPSDLIMNLATGEIGRPGDVPRTLFTKRVRKGMENYIRTVYQVGVPR